MSPTLCFFHADHVTWSTAKGLVLTNPREPDLGSKRTGWRWR